MEFKKEKLAQAGDSAKEQADIKRLALVNAGIKNAASDDDYQALVKQLSLLSETDPKDEPQREFIIKKMEAIKESYIKTALSGGKYIPPVFPKYVPPPEEPSFMNKVANAVAPDFFKKAVSNVMNTPSGGAVGTYVPGKGIVYNQ
jgi:hypothetical protein